MSEFYTCQGNVRDLSQNWGNVGEKFLLGKIVQNFAKRCIFNWLFSILYLVFYTVSP